jgi:hypothetical protein
VTESPPPGRTDVATTPTRFDRRQERIVDRLSRLIGPGAVSFFTDVVTLMGEPRMLDSVTHVVAHLLRETQGTILDILAPPSKRQARSPRRTGATTPVEQDDADGLEYPKRVKEVLARLGVDVGSPLGTSWLRLADRDEEEGLAKRAHRPALDAVRPVSPETEAFWSEVQFVFDGVLDAFEARFDRMLDDVHQLLAKAPSRKAARTLRSRIPNSPMLRLPFFQGAGPDWFEPLEKEGFFAQPPPDASGEKWYRWCQSTYLARMARVDELQEGVAQVIGALEPTANYRMQTDLLSAATALPAPFAAKWVAKESAWLDQQKGLEPHLADDLATFAASLAASGECGSAIRLARTLLGLAEGRVGRTQFSRLGARPLFDHYYYVRIAAKLEGIVPACGEGMFEGAVDILESAVRGRIDDAGRHYDGSDAWCEKIGEVRQHDDDIAATLVKTARDAALVAIRGDPAALDRVCKRLGRAGWPIFRRLELELLVACPSASMERVAAALMDRELFDREVTWPEYRALLEGSWERLSSSQQATILGWIEVGPHDE